MDDKQKSDTKKDDEQTYVRKWSLFIKWVFVLCVIVIVALSVFGICYFCGALEKYAQAIAKRETHAVSFTVVLILSIAFGYILLSLYNFLSHKSDEDVRMNCLPIIYSFVCLMVENYLLSLFQNVVKDGQFVISSSNFYNVTMSVLSSIAVGVITFASLKYAYEMSSHRSRLIESANAKPDIKVKKTGDGCYSAEIKNNSCYLCGLYVGKIDKIIYRDVKRTGNMFRLSTLFYPNQKTMFEKNQEQHIDFSKFLPEEIEIKSLVECAGKHKHDIYLVFRDLQHYYYFAKLPIDANDYKVYGTNENMVTRLLYKYNKWQHKYLRNKDDKNPKAKITLLSTYQWIGLKFRIILIPINTEYLIRPTNLR